MPSTPHRHPDRSQRRGIPPILPDRNPVTRRVAGVKSAPTAVPHGVSRQDPRGFVCTRFRSGQARCGGATDRAKDSTSPARASPERPEWGRSGLAACPYQLCNLASVVPLDVIPTSPTRRPIAVVIILIVVFAMMASPRVHIVRLVVAHQARQDSSKSSLLSRIGGPVGPVTIEDIEQVIEHRSVPFRAEPDMQKPRPHPTG